MKTTTVPANLTAEKKAYTVRPTGEHLDDLISAAKLLREANDQIGAAEKTKDAAKAFISRWLLENRGITVDALAIGDTVTIESVLLLIVGKQDRFDSKAFAIDHPDMSAEYTRRNPCLQFRPLV